MLVIVTSVISSIALLFTAKFIHARSDVAGSHAAVT
jgi:hypothetical protein